MIRLPQVLKLKNYSRLYYAGFSSELGAFITETALMLLVFELSQKNNAWLGITRAVFLISLTLGSLSGGPLGQIFNRKLILITSYFIRLPAIAAIFFFEDVVFIVLMNAVIAFATGIYNPSRQALINELVPAKHIREANALFGSTMAILHLIGPFVGASLFVYFAGIHEILAFNILTYALGIYLLLKIIYHPPKPIESNSKSFLFQLNDGLKKMWQREDLRALLTNSLFAGFCVGVLVPLLLPFTTQVLGQPETSYGLLLSFFGLGGLIGGYLSKKLSDSFEAGKIIVVSICMEPILMFLWILAPFFLLNLVVFFFWGMSVFIRIPSQLNYLSESIETDYLTRAHSLLDMSFVVPNILGSIVIGMLGNIYGPKMILSFTATFFFFVIYPRLFTKSVQALYQSKYEKVSRTELNIENI